MSKLDYVTIGIVIICVAALGYLVYSVINLMGDPKPAPTEQTTEPADDFYDEEDTYNYEEEGEAATDAEPYPGADSTRLGYEEEEPGATDPEEGEGQTTTYQEETTADDYTTDERETATTPDSYATSGNYLVLAGSFRYRDNAQSQADRLRELGYGQAQVTLFNQGAFATVLVNRFSALNDAQALVRELRTQHGVEAYVHEKREQR